MLNELKLELAESKKDLTALSSEVAELRTLSQTLKQKIEKERSVHRRQLWQNRLWFLIIGAGVGYAAHNG